MGKSHRGPVLGVVGGVGSGKSTFAAALADEGCHLLDADAIGHELLDEPTVRQAIVGKWGDGILGPSGRVDRPSLAKLVFADANALSVLDGIMHPLIAQRLAEGIRRAPASAQAVVIDAAVLFEAGWRRLCDRTIFIDAADEQRLDQVKRSRGWEESQWRARENSQIPLDTKRGLCDHIVCNCSGVSHLRYQAQKVLRRILVEWGRSS